MFCPKCGNQIADSAAFCPLCGASVSQPAAQPAQPSVQPVQQAAQPVQPAVPNPLVENLLKALKSFFSKDILGGLTNASRSTTMEWIPVVAAYVLFFALSVPIFAKFTVRHMTSSIAMVGSALSSAVPFGSFFGMSLLVAVIAMAMIVGGAFFQVRILQKKAVAFGAVINVVAYASLPVILAVILNMLLSLIWTPLAILVFVAAVIMQILLLYTGLQKLSEAEEPSFYSFSLVTFVCVAVILGLSALLYKNCLESMVNNLVGNTLGSLFGSSKNSGLGSLLDML